MKKLIIVLISLFILLLASTSWAVEIKNNEDNDYEQFLILTEEEYQSIYDDPYKLFSGVWIFDIGSKMEANTLKFKETSSKIPKELVKEDQDIELELSMSSMRMNPHNYPSVFTKDYFFTVVVGEKKIANLNIFTIGKDNICFGYRLKIYSSNKRLVYQQDPILKLTNGHSRVIDIELPSGEILKSVEVENYVHGLYINRFDEIFRSIYKQIYNNYESAMAKRPEIITKYKDAVGMGEYKLGMSIEEAQIVDTQLREASRDVEQLKIYTEYGDVLFSLNIYSSGSFRLYFSMTGNGLVAIRKYLEDQEIQPTAEHIKKNYQGEMFKYNKSNERHLPAINIIIGRNGDKARYMMDASGLGSTNVVIYQPWLYDRAVEVIKERQQQEAAKSKSALD